MAVARGMLGRPVLPLSSIIAHSPNVVTSRGSASLGGCEAKGSGSFVRFYGSPASRLREGNDSASPKLLSNFGNSGNCVKLSGQSADLESISGTKRRGRSRGFLSMATATSQTFPVEEGAEYMIQERILAHQKTAAKLSAVEEARTLLHQTTVGTLSTISKKYDGFPVGSLVTYATDEEGRIIMSISSLAPHTKDLELNPKCSLLVPKDPTDKSDTIVTIIGEALSVSEEDKAAVRTTFLKRHPGAFWVDFGDFRFVRIQPRSVRYVSGLVTGLAAVAEFTAQQFQAANVDPISQFATPIAGHMNRDHSDQTAQIVENSVGIKVDSALIQDVDRFGFGVLAKREGEPLKLRIPFPRPAEDRKAVKTLIIEMLAPKDK